MLHRKLRVGGGSLTKATAEAANDDLILGGVLSDAWGLAAGRVLPNRRTSEHADPAGRVEARQLAARTLQTETTARRHRAHLLGLDKLRARSQSKSRCWRCQIEVVS